MNMNKYEYSKSTTISYRYSGMVSYHCWSRGVAASLDDMSGLSLQWVAEDRWPFYRRVPAVWWGF